MKRILIALLGLLLSASAAQARHARGGGTIGGGGGGATLVFDYSAGFSGSPLVAIVGAATVSGSNLLLTDGVSHHCGALWYNTVQNSGAFSTEFTFQIPGEMGYGMVFAIQNSNTTTNGGSLNEYGLNAGGYSANGIGYGAGGGTVSPQPPMGNNVAIVFSTSSFNTPSADVSIGTPVTMVGLFVDGGPAIGNNSTNKGFAPAIDLHRLGVNIGSDDVMDAVVTYSGTTLMMVLTDTSTGASTRLSWPVNIPAVVGASTAYIGFTSCTPNSGTPITTLTGWKFYSGYNTQLAMPTFSVTPGQYSSTQSVSLSATPGASIYYTTDGTPPTTASTRYTGTAISVSTSQLINAIAVESNFTDSPVAQGNYRIQASSTPLINFPSGFASAHGLVQTVGYATISGSSIALTDTTNQTEIGNAWYVTPVPVSSNFSTTFTVDLTNTSGNGTGFGFVLQNYPTTTSGNTNYNLQLGVSPQGLVVVSGGPWSLSGYQLNMGYTGTATSVAVVFEYDSGNNLTGLYTDGAYPSGSSIDMTSSGVNLQSGHPFTVNLNYNASTTTLTETVTDTVNSDVFTHAYTVDIPGTVGGSTAYVGFTAASPEFVSGADLSIAAWTF